MGEIDEAVSRALEEQQDSKFNSLIAALVAATATLMALGNIKDGNITQNMQQAQVKAVDLWSYYQSKSTKQHLAENALEMVQLRLDTEPNLSQEARQRLGESVRRYETQVKKYEAEKAKIKADAEESEAEYARLNVHDDQLDMAEACFTVSIALYGITALTRRRWLLGFALALTVCGTLLFLCAFLDWQFRPEWLARFLG